MNQSVSRYRLFTGFAIMMSKLLDKVGTNPITQLEITKNVDWLEKEFVVLLNNYDEARFIELYGDARIAELKSFMKEAE